MPTTDLENIKVEKVINTESGKQSNRINKLARKFRICSTR